jgi:hypothetical protein
MPEPRIRKFNKEKAAGYTKFCYAGKRNSDNIADCSWLEKIINRQFT